MFNCKLYGEQCDIKVKTDTILSYVYAHGQLQEILKTDILCYNSQDQLLLHSLDYTEGVFPVTVVGNTGKEYPCVAFIWEKMKWMKGGLVVLSDDMESYLYAAEQYKKKAILV